MPELPLATKAVHKQLAVQIAGKLFTVVCTVAQSFRHNCMITQYKRKVTVIL
jgi:hypothetical protein